MGKMNKKILEILENNQIYVHYDIKHQSLEMEHYTPLGEDFLFYIDYESSKDFVKEFGIYAENFDVDEEVAPLIESRGKFGIPESISDLVEDAKYKKQFLKKVYNELSEVV